MKKITIIFCLFAIISHKGFSQIQAVTDKGDQVFLYDDGTWKYANDSSEAEEKEIPLSNMAYGKNEKSTFEVKSTKVNAGVFINTKEWAYKKNPIADAQEYSFQGRGKDIYAMIITEITEIYKDTNQSVLELTTASGHRLDIVAKGNINEYITDVLVTPQLEGSIISTQKLRLNNIGVILMPADMSENIGALLFKSDGSIIGFFFQNRSKYDLS
jgi:hypothetical protein